MVRLNKCCCCIPVKTGAYAIGLLHAIGLFSGVRKLDPLLIVLEVFCGCSFLLMVFRDNESKRFSYFLSYIINMFLINTIRILVVTLQHSSLENAI